MKTINDHMKAVFAALCKGTTPAGVIYIHNRNPKRDSVSIYQSSFSNIVILDDGICVFTPHQKAYYRFDDISSIEILN